MKVRRLGSSCASDCRNSHPVTQLTRPRPSAPSTDSSLPVTSPVVTAEYPKHEETEAFAVFDASDACFAPVLGFTEARAHPHSVAREGSVRVGAIDQPAPAPRFDRTPGAVRHAAPERGAMGREALLDWGFDDGKIEQLAGIGLGFALDRRPDQS